MAKQLEFDFRRDIDPSDVSYRLLEEEQPQYRLEHLGEGALSLRELLAVVIGSGHSDDSILELTRLLGELGGLPGIASASITELTNYEGIGRAKAGRIKAALELGRRLATTPLEKRTKIRSPADASTGRPLTPRRAAPRPGITLRLGPGPGSGARGGSLHSAGCEDDSTSCHFLLLCFHVLYELLFQALAVRARRNARQSRSCENVFDVVSVFHGLSPPASS